MVTLSRRALASLFVSHLISAPVPIPVSTVAAMLAGSVYELTCRQSTSWTADDDSSTSKGDSAASGLMPHPASDHRSRFVHDGLSVCLLLVHLDVSSLVPSRVSTFASGVPVAMHPGTVADGLMKAYNTLREMAVVVRSLL